MTSGEFHSHIVKIVKRCQFPCPEAEERAIRDAIFMGMNSQWARDKAINLMNEEGKELTVDFLMNQLAIEDCNTQHKFLSQLNSSSSVNFAAYDCRLNRGKSNKPKHTSGKNGVQNKPGVQTSSTNSQPSRKPPGMEGKCMRCTKNVPNIKYSTSTGTSTGTSSNVFQILQDLRLKQYQGNHPDSLQDESRTSHTSTHSTTGTLAQLTTSFRTIARDTTWNTVQPATSFRTIARDTTVNTVQLTTSFRTTPTKPTTGRNNTFRTTPNTMTKEQINPAQVFQDMSRNTHLESCMHVHQPMSQVCKPGESLALRKSSIHSMAGLL